MRSKETPKKLIENFWVQGNWWEVWLGIHNRCSRAKTDFHIDSVDERMFRSFYDSVSKERSASFRNSFKEWLLHQKRTFLFSADIERFIKTFFDREPVHSVHSFQSYILIILTQQTDKLHSHLQTVRQSAIEKSYWFACMVEFFVSCEWNIHALAQTHFLVLRDEQTLGQAVEFWEIFKSKSQSFYKPKLIWVDIERCISDPLYVQEFPLSAIGLRTRYR